MHFFISTQRYVRGYQKRWPLENKSQKRKEIIIKPFIFMRNLSCCFTAVQCRSALRQGCYNPKEMKGFSTNYTYRSYRGKAKDPRYMQRKMKGSKNYLRTRCNLILCFSFCQTCLETIIVV
jgi:hypothetical protein